MHEKRLPKNISGLLQTFGHAALRDWFKVHSQQFWNIFLTWLKSNMQSANVRPSNAWFTFPLLNLDKCYLSFGPICISAFPSGSPDLKKNYVFNLQSDMSPMSSELRSNCPPPPPPQHPSQNLRCHLSQFKNDCFKFSLWEAIPVQMFT